jgi:type IV pilus assembly protein PilM
VFRRTYLGLDIRDNGLRAIAVQRAGAGVALLGGQILQLREGVLRPGAQEPNICQPEHFIEVVQEVLLPLSRRENRIAVTLPDTSGHIFLLNIETPFKNPQEGDEIIRWHLKDRLPANNRTVALAYQILEERDSGSKRLLVSVISREILRQYEDVLAKAGFGAAVIDFHSLNIYNAYRSRVDLGTDFMVVSVDGNQLSLLAFENLKLDFYRIKTVPFDAAVVFQELNRSLVGYRRSHSAFARALIYLHSNWAQMDELQEAVQSAFEREIELLPSPLQQLINYEKLAIPTAEANSMAAALGVAERLISRVRG